MRNRYRFARPLGPLALLLVSLSAASVAAVEDELGVFGVGSCYINNRSVADNARWIPRMSAIGITSYRTPHTDWSAVGPARGKWSWEALDAQMRYLADQHLEFGGLLHGNARWNTNDPPGTLPAHDLAGWSNYVFHVVEHARGKIKYWEVWNEPPNGTGRDQTPADYARIMIHAHDAAKVADSAARIGLAAKSVHVNYLEQVIQAGAKDHFDFITLHPYEVLNGIADNTGTESVFLHIVPTVRKMLRAQDPARAEVPIIFTELGCDARKGTDAQAHALVKAYAMGIAQGVACIEWFEGRDGDSGPMGLLDAQGTPRPAYTALGCLIKHLGPHPQYLGWVLWNGRNPGFLFRGARTPVLVSWGAKDAHDRVSFGRACEWVNPLSGAATSGVDCELTVAPILLLDAPGDLVEEAKRNRTRPWSWGGDYATARSVSIQMEEANPERGLHALSGNAVAQAVVAYGGSARAGNLPGGNLFIVDPEFLAYTPTPIEITAVVRRNPANDNAGFKLVYESTNGFKTAGGWYTVPDNKQWHTISWKIADPEFVNYWGYNFALESDGNTYNKYFLKSLTVTKRGP